MFKSGRKTRIWQGLQIIFILSGNVYMYLSCNVKKKPKQLLNCLKREKQMSFLPIAHDESDTRETMSWSVTVYIYK